MYNSDDTLLLIINKINKKVVRISNIKKKSKKYVTSV